MRSAIAAVSVFCLAVPAIVVGTARRAQGQPEEQAQERAQEPPQNQQAPHQVTPGQAEDDRAAEERQEIEQAAPDRTPSDVHTYKIQPVDDGTFRYEGRAFSAVIQPDGTVEFHTKHVAIHTGTGDFLTGMNDGRNPKNWPIWPVPLPTQFRPTLYDEREQLQKTLTPLIPVAEPIIIDPGIRYDLSDEYARARGQDPYEAEKVTFLNDTFDMRMKLAGRFHKQALHDALDALPDRLQLIWTDPHLTPAERRQIIYVLWDETADDAGGAAARKIITAFVDENFTPADAARFKE
jgi:hypothetical protein